MTSELLDDENKYNKMAQSVNPYGNGTASEKIVRIIKDSFITTMSDT